MFALTRSELAVLLLALGFAAAMQICFPIFSDEAYLISWGDRPALVYYDHPPLTGWVSAVLTGAEHALGWLPHGTAHRIFSLLLYMVAAVMILRRHRAGWAVFLALPGMAIVFNMYLNDTLLVFLCLLFFVATDALWRGARGTLWPVLLAASISLAVLTKFLFGLYYLAVVLALLGDARGRRVLFGPFLGASLVGALVFAGFLWVQSGACSVTLGFNFAFRGWEKGAFDGVWEGLAALALVGGPGLLIFAYSALRHGAAARIGFPARALFWSCFLLPVAGLYTGRIGLHWALPICLPLVMAIGGLGGAARGRAVVWSAAYGWLFLGTLGLAIGLAGAGPGVLRDRLSETVLYEIDAAYDLSDGSLPRALAAVRGDRVLAGTSHHLSAAMVNAELPDVTTLTKSVYGRNQDLTTDFSRLDGRDFLILPSVAFPDLGLLRRLFDSVRVIQVETGRRRYRVVAGDGFDFEAFRSAVMAPVIENYYDKNPFPSRACFIDRYR